MAALLSRLFGRRSAGPGWLDIAELQRRLAAGPVALIDVRQPEEYASPPGHLPGAINIPLGDLGGRMSELAARSEPVLVVCKTDRRSAHAAAEMVAAGLRDVAVLRGGTDAWHAKGLALE